MNDADGEDYAGVPGMSAETDDEAAGPRDAVPTTTCFAPLLLAAAGGRRVAKPFGTRRTWIMVPLASALGLSDSQLTPLRVLKSLRLARIMRLLE